LTGSEGYTLTETGNNNTGVSSGTDAGSGTYTLSDTGPGHTLTPGSGSYSYSGLERGDATSGTFSRTQTGTNRYGLLEYWNDVSNTASGKTPGNMIFSLVGRPFVDPETWNPFTWTANEWNALGGGLKEGFVNVANGTVKAAKETVFMVADVGKAGGSAVSLAGNAVLGTPVYVPQYDSSIAKGAVAAGNQGKLTGYTVGCIIDGASLGTVPIIKALISGDPVVCGDAAGGAIVNATIAIITQAAINAVRPGPLARPAGYTRMQDFIPNLDNPATAANTQLTPQQAFALQENLPPRLAEAIATRPTQHDRSTANPPKNRGTPPAPHTCRTSGVPPAHA
jgi:hypothetical protein